MTGALKYHEPGIYFDMPEAEYLADASLSNSGIQNLRVSPLTYWVNSPLNPDFEPDETDATSTGKAFHKRILEGKAAFEAAYAPRIERDDYPGALASGEELREHCEKLGLPKSGTLAEMGKRIRRIDHDVKLLSEIVDAHLEQHKGKEFLPRLAIGQIELAASAIEANPATAALFRGGFPEVSIFWVDQATGVRMKARLDYLTPEFIVDLKTFSNSQGKPLGQAVTYAMANYGYGVQAVTYLRAVSAAREFACDRLKLPGDSRFVFVFQESGRVPNVAVRELNRNTNYYDINVFSYEHAVGLYRDCVQRWGFDKPWVEDAQIAMLEDEDFPLWTFN